MNASEIAAARAELGRHRQQIDLAIGAAMQSLERMERDARERERDQRLTGAELASFSYDLDHPLRTDDCERCGFAWQSCVCNANAVRP
ncbi:MAG TPA: hypothetical protein VJN18_14860 [Polyangiaceae bacterium]|nr:hypothetical protein [Polyangiaceae bacterium]